MNHQSIPEKVFWLLIAALLVGMGLIISDYILDNYSIIVNGILGLLVIYFHLQIFGVLPIIKFRQTSSFFRFPNNLQYLAIVFFSAIIINFSIAKILYAFRCSIIPTILGN